MYLLLFLFHNFAYCSPDKVRSSLVADLVFCQLSPLGERLQTNTLLEMTKLATDDRPLDTKAIVV